MNQKFIPFIRKLQNDFALLCLIVFILELFYLPRIFVPSHDTMAVFQNFYFFYNELVSHGDIAQWMPYSSFGISSHYFQLNALTPLSYVCLFAGWIGKVSDVLLLYKISLLMEKIVFLLGMYLLGRTLFASRVTTFLICLGALCSSHCLTQIFFDLKIFYMLPLGLYFLTLFFQKQRGEFFWLTGITTILWAIGNPPYYGMLWFFVYSIVAGMFFFFNRDVWKSVFQNNRANKMCGLVFLILAGIYCLQVKSIQETLSLVQGVGRGSSGRNTLGMFLTYGGSLDFGKYLSWIVAGAADISYMGIVVVVFAILAFLRVRTKNFFVFSAGAVALIWLSMGGVFSAIAYFFPGMAYYRHISLICGLIKVFVLVCAGFGLEYFWEADLKTKIRSLLTAVIVLILALDLFRVTSDQLAYLSSHDDQAKALVTSLDFSSLAFRLKSYALAGGMLAVIVFVVRVFQRKKGIPVSQSALKRIFQTGIVLAYLLDFASFQTYIYKVEARQSPDAPGLKAMDLHPMRFQEERREEPVEQRQKDALSLVLSLPGSVTYSTAYNFLQFDSCRSLFREDFVSRETLRLFNLKDLKEADFKQISGCETSKIRLVSDVVMFKTDQESIQFLKDSPNWAQTVVLNRSDRPQEGAKKESVENKPSSIGLKQSERPVFVKKFSANEIVMDVETPLPKWLIYADSFHPDWRATIDGKLTSIHKAYLAFKAVEVPPGRHEVRMFFGNSWRVMGSYLVALTGLLGGVILLGGILFVFVLGYEGRNFSQYRKV